MTRKLLAGLEGLGSTHGTLLDVGAGIGILSFELLKVGVDRAQCVDLSPVSLTTGRAEAERQGLADRIQWREGDFVSVAAELEPADVVSLDRVVCCYPAYGPLLAEAAGHSRRLIALSYPRGRWFVRLTIWAENLFRQLRGSSFRSFVHSPAAMDAQLRQSGFTRQYRESTISWHADVYVRDRGAFPA